MATAKEAVPVNESKIKTPEEKIDMLTNRKKKKILAFPK